MTAAEENKIQYDSIDISDVRVMRIRDKRVDSRISTLYKQEFVAFRTDDMVNVIVDLSDVEFMDSSGLGALLLGRRMFTEDGGDLKIVGAHDRVMGMFRIAKLDRVFNFYDSTDAAVAKFIEQSV